MVITLRIKPGILKHVRDLRNIPSEAVQARLIGVDRATLRRVDRGSTPSGFFIANFCGAFDLEIGEAFEVVTTDSPLSNRSSEAA